MTFYLTSVLLHTGGTEYTLHTYAHYTHFITDLPTKLWSETWLILFPHSQYIQPENKAREAWLKGYTGTTSSDEITLNTSQKHLKYHEQKVCSVNPRLSSEFLYINLLPLAHSSIFLLLVLQQLIFINHHINHCAAATEKLTVQFA